MGYPQISAAQVENHDVYGDHNAVNVAAILKEFSQNVSSPKVTAGSTGATVTETFFVCPVKMVVTKGTFVMDVVQTGTGNTPTVNIYNLTKGEVVGVSASIALSGTIGDKVDIPITAANADCDSGDVLQVKVINPSATITVALQGKVQMEWNAVK